MNDTAEQQIAEQAGTTPATSNGSALVHMIERAARDDQVDIDKMERLYEMYQRETARQAEAAFNRALSEAQKQMRRVAADAENPQTKSRYASYAALDRALRPLYTELGFSISFGEQDSPREDHVRVVAYVSHQDGHTREYHRDIPVTTTGIQGKVNMTQTHASASAVSYGMRYLLKMIFNVAVGEDDDDGNGPGEPVEKITEDQVAEIENRIDALVESGQMAESKPFFDWMKTQLGVTNLADLNQQGYETVCAALAKKEKGGASKKKAASKKGSK